MLAVILAVGVTGAANGAERPHYDVRVRLDPDAGTLDAHVEITAPGTTSFVLGRDLVADARPC